MTRTSGILLFGLQLHCVMKNREKNQNHKRTRNILNPVKPVNEASSSTLTKRAKNLAIHMHKNFQDQSKEYYNQDDVLVLESLKFSTNIKSYEINYGSQNKENKRQKVQAIVQATDQGLISREGYRNLASIEYNLPREYLVSLEKTNINKKMENLIPIKLVNIHTTRSEIGFNEDADIINEEIVEQMVSAIG